MHVGLVMECDHREGRTQEEAFSEAMTIAEIAETEGLDGVWLAELASLADPRLVPREVAAAVDLRDVRQADLTAALLDFLKGLG